MAWIMDTYSMHKRHTVTGVVTGKPIAMGGSLGPQGRHRTRLPGRDAVRARQEEDEGARSHGRGAGVRQRRLDCRAPDVARPA